MSTSQSVSDAIQDGSSSVNRANTPVASAVHTIALIAFLAGWTYFGLVHTNYMRGQTVPNHLLLYFPTMVMEWSVFAFIAWSVRKHGVTLRELIGPRWSSPMQFFTDLGIGIAFQLGSLFVVTCLTLLIHANQDPSRVMFMMPRGPLELAVWVLLSLTAGICEETIFRGYFQRQFVSWTGNTVAGILISAVLFGAIHLYQGGKQTIVIGALGAMFGGLAAYRRSLKPGMIAHFLQDGVTGVVLSLMRK
jgi:membrane protease YdiL (CAAX protease family)